MTESSALEAAITFTELKLAPEIVQAVTELGYSVPTPIQKEAIPLAAKVVSSMLAGSDYAKLFADSLTDTL